MNTDTKTQEKKTGSDPATPRKIHNVPLSKDIERCKGCPFPGVGFICWSTDGSCMRTDVDRISRPRR